MIEARFPVEYRENPNDEPGLVLGDDGVVYVVTKTGARVALTGGGSGGGDLELVTFDLSWDNPDLVDGAPFYTLQPGDLLYNAAASVPPPGWTTAEIAGLWVFADGANVDYSNGAGFVLGAEVGAPGATDQAANNIQNSLIVPTTGQALYAFPSVPQVIKASVSQYSSSPQPGTDAGASDGTARIMLFIAKGALPS